jgi:hypothetical protein
MKYQYGATYSPLAPFTDVGLLRTETKFLNFIL